MKTAPFLREPLHVRSCKADLLGRQKLLRESDRIDGAQRRCSWRQILWTQCNVLIEEVIPVWRAVNRAPVLVSSDGLPIVVEAHQRTLVVGVNSSPVFEILQEVVHSSVRSKVCHFSGRIDKRDSLSGNQSRAIGRLHRITIVRLAVVNYKRPNKRIHIIPVVGEQRYSVRDDYRGYA